MSSKSVVLSLAVVFLICFLAAGCAPEVKQPIQQVAPQPVLFPPQAIMQSGDYAGFLAENSETLKSCDNPEKCTLALFNLSFLYCYAKSPYYNPQTGLKYIEDLIKGAPDSVWTYQAIVWRDGIYRNMKKQTRRRTAHEDSKTKETPELQADDLAKVDVEPPQEIDPGTDRQAMEEKIKEQEETINKLNRQLERSREIDIEIEKKERGLLY
jgi:hypothetical protein